MSFWENPVVLTLLVLAVLLALSELVRGLIPPLKSIGVPASIVAGCLGMLLGPSILGWLPMDSDVLEALVYHGLAIVFIAVSLESPKEGGGPGARSMAFGITTMVATQTAVGLALVLALTLLMGPLHPGFGLLLPLGFEQGPGQALSLGKAWEQSGMPDGAQVGLIIAAIGFAWSIGMGVPLVVYGRKKGWVSERRSGATDDHAASASDSLPPGALELLTRQGIAIASIYALAYLACLGLSKALMSANAPDIANMIWGFHFMIGALIAMGARPLLTRLPGGNPLDDRLLGRIAGSVVDVLTVAALSAVQLAILGAHLLPILVVTTVGGLVTLVITVAASRRAYPEAWFEHCVLWFGMSTGTLPMGLALLRIIDPELESPAPVSAVLGSAGAIIGVAPIVLVLHPIPIAGWAESFPGSTALALGLTCAYLAVTVGLWWWTSMRGRPVPA